ncbi:DUF4190 domain-containing protein [Streptomyces sp. ISL-94]|uniref:DUF4190 domain-containing protein n=1 Tax=Streptomyces sp. ISL-94 TaxID=2819190 RepID=UPI001BE80435|nr:DUF4190 domain-containing protein [Streptomyces sp. ISL-94]MBT2482369.1 DUF4190 domain-containing protein [Streptomyces sp. ISL-94]
MSIPPQPPSSPGPYSQSGPYGQPGQPGPYGGPQGWHAPPQMPLTPQKTNALAIVAFVMSIVCALPLVPLILGIIALSQIRNRGEKGKGFAIAAIAIHSATIALSAIALIFGFSGALDDGPPPKRDSSGQVTTPGSIDVEDIRTGDCFNTGGKLAEYNDEDGGQAGFSVKIVPCGEPHEGEAYTVATLEDGAYPGKDKVISIAEEKCGGTALTDYVGDDAKLPETLEVFYYYPQRATWIRGDREVTCFLGHTNGPSTGSVRATGS